jgi:hypothetical protein
MDKNKCPKFEKPKYFMKKECLRCIIKNYGVDTKKIIFILLRYFFYKDLNILYCGILS